MKSFCGLRGLRCGKGLARWCTSDVDIVHYYVNSGRLPFCLNSSRPLFDMWGRAFTGWHEAESTLCNICDSVVANLCCCTGYSTLQVPVHMYIYRYRAEAHEMFVVQSLTIPKCIYGRVTLKPIEPKRFNGLTHEC